MGWYLSDFLYFLLKCFGFLCDFCCFCCIFKYKIWNTKYKYIFTFPAVKGWWWVCVDAHKGELQWGGELPYQLVIATTLLSYEYSWIFIFIARARARVGVIFHIWIFVRIGVFIQCTPFLEFFIHIYLDIFRIGVLYQ